MLFVGGRTFSLGVESTTTPIGREEEEVEDRGQSYHRSG